MYLANWNCCLTLLGVDNFCFQCNTCVLSVVLLSSTWLKDNLCFITRQSWPKIRWVAQELTLTAHLRKLQSGLTSSINQSINQLGSQSANQCSVCKCSTKHYVWALRLLLASFWSLYCVCWFPPANQINLRMEVYFFSFVQFVSVSLCRWAGHVELTGLL